jgi:cGMP-dependent protein kinase
LNHDIVAMSDCITLEAEWSGIISYLDLNIDPKKILSFLIRLSHLKKIQIFKHLSDKKLLEICRLMKKVKFRDEEVILKEGLVGNFLYLLYKGKVKIFKNENFIRELGEGNCFGEISLLRNEVHSATVKACSFVSAYTFSKEDFNKAVDKNMLDFLQKKIALQDNFSIKIDDLYYLKNLGEGKFGAVSLVHNMKNVYAIKAVNRKAAEKQKILIKYIQKERNILLILDHPFIIKLVKTLKNEDYIFYLMEYVNGLVLSKYLENRAENRVKSPFEMQFYIASLLLIINYLNSKRIAHRDIKPDNIMVDEKGYLKMIDFGTALVIKDFTTTITGTPHYIAPEVLLGKGYNFSSDYWSIGITAFEIFFNYYPFGNKANDPIEVYKEVVKK